jgi:serine/threonine protein kinase/Tfp pilus assembly protein PilF/TolB-like protein
MPLARGSSIGPYEIVMRLGSGGMGEVYRARDPRLGREVAIKVLLEGAAPDRDRLRRFISEAKAASALNHPNILTVHEIGETESGPYIVTELVEGQTVREMVVAGALPVSRALDIAIQTAEGIAKAHEAGIIHRDIKPENLMVTRDGYVKILDFGLAKLLRPESVETGASAASTTKTGMIVGTAGYLSPEQLRGSPADARSDVFSLGIVLYEMIAGENPFRRDNAADIFSAILRDEPPPLRDRATSAAAMGSTAGVPPDLSDAVRRALAKKADDRFPSARSFAAELKRIRARLDSGASADTVVQSGTTPAAGRRRWWPAATAAGALLLAVALLLWRRESASSPPMRLPANVALAVAVLPVSDESGDPELSRAGIGKILADAFVQVLSDIPRVYVVSPIRVDQVAQKLGRSVMEAAKDSAFAHRISEKAGATAMLTGSLGRVGKTYVLNASLYELPSDRILQSFRAESQNSDQLLPDLTAGVASMVRQKLGASSAEASGSSVEKVATGSVEAYAHFVRGKDLSSEGLWKEAIPELQKALQISPQMAVAWSELGCAYSFFGDDANAQAAQKKAESLLDHANNKERKWIEWSSIWIRSASGDLYCAEGDKFIRQFPDDREGYFYTGLGHEYLRGDCEKALAYYEKAYNLTPNYYPITKAIVDCQLKLQHKDRAIAALKRYRALPWLSDHGRQQADWRLADVQKKG